MKRPIEALTNAPKAIERIRHALAMARLRTDDVDVVEEAIRLLTEERDRLYSEMDEITGETSRGDNLEHPPQ